MLNIDKSHCLYQFGPEYASSVWDPYQYNKIYIIDRIQHRAAHWSLCSYDRYSSVTLMQHQLNWQNLQQRQKIARLSLLHKALYDHIVLQVPPYYTLSHSNTRANHQFSFIHPSTRTKVHKYIFYSKLSNIGIIFHQIWHQLNLQQNSLN